MQQFEEAYRIFIKLVIMEILCYDFIITREFDIYRQITVAAEIEKR